MRQMHSLKRKQDRGLQSSKWLMVYDGLQNILPGSVQNQLMLRRCHSFRVSTVTSIYLDLERLWDIEGSQPDKLFPDFSD